MTSTASALSGSTGNGPVSSGKANHGAPKGGRSFAHIDDIVHTSIFVDIAMPIERLLLTADTYMRQAESSNSFGRVDLALQDYIRARTIILDLVRKNKDWGTLQGSPTLLKRYNRLLGQVESADPRFEDLQAVIIADNVRTGVQPKAIHADPVAWPPAPRGATTGSGAGPSAETNGSLIDTSTAFNAPPSRPAPPQTKSKPAVQPKPAALHGRALSTGAGKPAVNAAAGPGSDLEARFARLRVNTTKPVVQDPRIRTQPIVVPDDFPPPPPRSSRRPPARLSLETTLPDNVAALPKVPDAIYNPARGTVSSEAAELPSSAPRAMFTRTGVTATSPNFSYPVTNPLGSRKSTPTEEHFPPTIFSPPPEFFAPTQSFSRRPTPPPAPAAPPKRAKLTLPDGDTLSAEQLMEYMRIGAKDVSILLIDIRSRQEFNEGHIMSQATICVEPEVLARADISADEIADSMEVGASEQEKLLFEKRREFSIVIFYDADSRRISKSPVTLAEKAALGLYKALSLFDYASGSFTSTNVKMLSGGLTAWTNLVGEASLQTSTSILPSKSSLAPMAKSLMGPRQSYVARPIQDPSEAKRWLDASTDIEGISLLRTTEDFLRRYPAISTERESMISPVRTEAATHVWPLYEGANLPSPPTRPPPALPRRVYSGLAEAQETTSAAKSLAVSPPGHRRPYRTGLQNPHNLCYMNSFLQAWFASPGLSAEISNGSWKELYRVPKKKNEIIENPQVLTKILESLFRWLDAGKHTYFPATVLAEYMKDVCKRNNSPTILGSNQQQDVQELVQFILQNVHDETNIFRDKPDPAPNAEYDSFNASVTQHAMTYWSRHTSFNKSLMTKYFSTLDVGINGCQQCGYVFFTYQPAPVKILNFDPDAKSKAFDLDDLLKYSGHSETVSDARCDKCKSVGRRRKSTALARTGDLIMFYISRFGQSSDGDIEKLTCKLTFPFQALDLTPYMADGAGYGGGFGSDWHYGGRQLFDCYAVITHSGDTPDSGHYMAYVQDDQSANPSDWFFCNDTNVTPIKVDRSMSREDWADKIYQSRQSGTPVMLFYRRRGFQG